MCVCMCCSTKLPPISVSRECPTLCPFTENSFLFILSGLGNYCPILADCEFQLLWNLKHAGSHNAYSLVTLLLSSRSTHVVVCARISFLLAGRIANACNLNTWEVGDRKIKSSKSSLYYIVSLKTKQSSQETLSQKLS